jgi:hypothetical protein
MNLIQQPLSPFRGKKEILYICRDFSEPIREQAAGENLPD